MGKVLMLKDRIKRFLYAFVGMSCPNQLPCIYKTIIFNFIAFGIKGIIHVPVIVYGNTKIYRVGKININCKIQRGLVTLGKLDYKSQGVTKFLNAGEINVNGPVEIGGCSIIENFGTISFYGYNRIADGTLLVIRDFLKIGKYSRIGFHSFIMDSDDHFTLDVNTLVVPNKSKGITIGSYNWIASKTTIKKGVITPDYTIVASANALLTKDYTSIIPAYSVIGGSPAKLLKTGVRRIYNNHIEKEITKYYSENKEIYELDSNLSKEQIDEFCKQKGLEF